jgi:hypothetical protein
MIFRKLIYGNYVSGNLQRLRCNPLPRLSIILRVLYVCYLFLSGANPQVI